jgi:hypothetical protein
VGHHPLEGRSWSSEGSASCLYERFILNEIWAHYKIYFGRHFAWLKYFTYRLVPVHTGSEL